MADISERERNMVIISAPPFLIAYMYETALGRPIVIFVSRDFFVREGNTVYAQ